MRRRSLPDAATTANICTYIRGGAYQWVAAVASGVSKHKFHEWMTGDTPEELDFQHAVTTAFAQCRAEGELVMRREYTKEWFLYGPGRERPGEPGWSKQTAVTGPNGEAFTKPPEVRNFDALTTDELRALSDLETKMLGPGKPDPEAN